MTPLDQIVVYLRFTPVNLSKFIGGFAADTWKSLAISESTLQFCGTSTFPWNF